MDAGYDAVVFAYHDVGVRCLAVLLAHGVNVRLVVTHPRRPRREHLVRERREARARQRHRGRDARRTRTRPSFLEARAARSRPTSSSRSTTGVMLSPALLGRAMRGAFNMHGSLLPKFRGRVPVNWAILRGEDTTGATPARDGREARRGPHRRPDGGADPARRPRRRRVPQGHRRRRDGAGPVAARGAGRHGAAHEQDLAAGSYCRGRTRRRTAASTGPSTARQRPRPGARRGPALSGRLHRAGRQAPAAAAHARRRQRGAAPGAAPCASTAGTSSRAAPTAACCASSNATSTASRSMRRRFARALRPRAGPPGRHPVKKICILGVNGFIGHHLSQPHPRRPPTGRSTAWT